MPSSRDNVGRIAGGLRGRLGLARGLRVGIAMENCGEYLQVLYGIWRAGMVAVPMNVKLHEKEIAFILENAGCEACFCTPDVARQARAARHLQAEATRHHLDADEGLCRPARVRPDRRGVQRGGGRGLAVLHQRDHRPSQGGRALLPQSAVHVALLLRRRRSSRRSRREPARRPPLARLGSLRAAPYRQGLAPHHHVGLLRAGPDLRRAGEAPARDDVRCAHHGVAAHQPSPGRVLRHERAQDALFRRRADVRERPEEGAGDLRTEAHADLRPGRVAHDDHVRLETAARPAGSSSPRGDPRLVRRAAHRRRRPGRRQRRPRAARRRDRRGDNPVRLRDGRLLEQPRRQRQGPARRLALDRRHGVHRRRGLPHAQGSLQGHDHLRRLQHLPSRARGGSAHPPDGARMRRGRARASGLGGGSDRVRGGAPGSARHARRISTPSASTTSRATSGRGSTGSSRASPRTATARSSRPTCDSS